MEDRTLTERVEQIERIVGREYGFAEFSGCDQTVTGEKQQNIRDRDFGGAFPSHAEAQRFRNESLSARIHQEPPQQTALEEIINRIQSSTCRIMERAAVLEAIGNRIMGALPEGENDDVAGANRGPDGTLNHTYLALNGLDYACARLEGAALRLERIRLPPRKNTQCRRGHVMDDRNTKRRPSTKYVACRQCERDAQMRRRKGKRA